MENNFNYVRKFHTLFLYFLIINVQLKINPRQQLYYNLSNYLKKYIIIIVLNIWRNQLYNIIKYISSHPIPYQPKDYFLGKVFNRLEYKLRYLNISTIHVSGNYDEDNRLKIDTCKNFMKAFGGKLYRIPLVDVKSNLLDNSKLVRDVELGYFILKITVLWRKNYNEVTGLKTGGLNYKKIVIGQIDVIQQGTLLFYVLWENINIGLNKKN
ncbi:unnamed protein product [Paramecium sonneborni]|uniref:Uncharacterized protein n=1 Tax=Paramecium sonneborni TaxID=65129 RepID=A0A8S1RTV5_9CILI|nr:unnamed protein product [Paramecium sonneborni]